MSAVSESTRITIYLLVSIPKQGFWRRVLFNTDYCTPSSVFWNTWNTYLFLFRFQHSHEFSFSFIQDKLFVYIAVLNHLSPCGCPLAEISLKLFWLTERNTKKHDLILKFTDNEIVPWFKSILNKDLNKNATKFKNLIKTFHSSERDFHCRAYHVRLLLISQWELLLNIWHKKKTSLKTKIF